MFELYTQKARRVIFFARYEASQYGSPYIETEHLLLGLLQENKTLLRWAVGRTLDEEKIRTEIESKITRRERISTSVEVPLSVDAKKVLVRATSKPRKWGIGGSGLSTFCWALSSWRARSPRKF